MNSITLFVSDSALIHKQRPVAYIGMVTPTIIVVNHCTSALHWVLEVTHAQSLKS